MDYEKQITTIIENNEIYKLKCMLDDCTDPFNEKLITNILSFKILTKISGRKLYLLLTIEKILIINK